MSVVNLTNAVRRSTLLLVAVTAFFAIGAASASAQSCPTQNPNGSIQCSGGTSWCGETCRTEPSCSAPKIRLDCASCGCVCPTDKPNDCTGTNGLCQANNSSCAGFFRTEVCDVTAGSTVRACGSCYSGYTDCSGTCKPTTNPACPPPSVYDPCTETCAEPFVRLNPGSLQSAEVKLSGARPLEVNGDVYLSSGKALRVDAAGATTFSVGNWGAGATGFDFLVSGKVGINTGTPGYPLDISSNSGTAEMRLNDTLGSLWTGLALSRSGAEKWYVGMDTGDSLLFRRNSGTNDMVISTAGNVGIGTAAPQRLLHVNSDSGMRVSRASNADQVIEFLGGDGAGLAQMNATYSMQIKAGGSTPNGYIKFVTGAGTETMRIDPAGNVGIGTTTPATKLDVNGILRTTQLQVVGGTPAAGKVLTSDVSGNATWQTPSSGLGGSGTTNYVTKFTAATTLGNSSIYDNGTNVGIGTTTPGARLSMGTLYDATGLNPTANLRLYESGNVVYGFGIQSGRLAINANQAGGYMVFNAGTDNSAPTERMRIASNGNVGIGTTLPEASLHVAGDMLLNNGNVLRMKRSSSGSIINVLGISGDVLTTVLPHSTAGTAAWTVSNTGSTRLLTINGDGATGIGTTSPGYPLDVQNLTASGTAIMRLANNSATKLWTGVSMYRGGVLPANEKWFIGMNNDAAATGESLRFRRAGATDDMVINTSGSVGIGTTNPLARLDVSGTTRTTSLQVTGGSPAVGQVLTATDTNGSVAWQSVSVGDCSLSTFKALSASSYDGSRGGYSGANATCGAGRHVCTPDEIMRTVACVPATLPANGNAWLSGGPPSFTSPAANDCGGWTSNATGAYGAYWQFGGATGGKGFATACNLSLQFACCGQ